MRYRLLIVVVAIELALPGAVIAADPRFPDWPCTQIKVPEVSVAAVWAGPSIDDVGDAWERDAVIKDLVARLAARRTPLDEAESTIAAFLARNAHERLQNARLLFAGLFTTLNRQRTQVMNGIERLFRQQRTFAKDIRSEIADLRTLHDGPDPDPRKIEELANKVDWDTRIFEERRKTISYACEVPTLIEQRLFALARTIQQEM